MRIKEMLFLFALLPLTNGMAESPSRDTGSFSVGVYGLADKTIGGFSEYAAFSAGGGCSVEWEPSPESPWGIVARAQGGTYLGTIDDIDSFGFVGAFVGGRWLVPVSSQVSIAPECSYGLWVNALNGSPYVDQAFQLSPLFRYAPNRVGYEFGPALTGVFNADGVMWMAGIRAGVRITIDTTGEK